MNAASLGDTALQSSDPTTATLHYTTALLTHPRSPSYFIKRSTAFSRLKPTPNLPAALRDAESAVLLARERGKRELIVEAQMRRAIVLFLMGRYVAAEGVVGVVERMVGLDKDGDGENKEEKVRRAMGGASGGAGKGVEAEVRIWGAKIRAKVQGLNGNEDGDGEKVEEVPVGVKVPGEKELRAQLEELRGGRSKSTIGGVSGDEGQKVEDNTAAEKEEVEEKSEVKETQQQQQQQQQVKVRHEWYQSGETVVVTLYVKGVPKDKVAIELKEDSTSLQFPLPSGAEYDFTLDPLFAPIDPSTSKVSVFSTKIEISLRKKSPGQKWSALESSIGVTPQPVTTTFTPTTTQVKPQAQGPSYPTSSRHGAKDWDKLASSLTQKSKKDKPKYKDATKAEGKGEGEGEDDEASDAESINSDFGGGDAVDGFFKKLYANADPDTRRAMVKSYVESQGTSLSTNWDEVGQGPVKVRPPSE
ncbi:CS-domain-containing protein [Aspergillus eucalypticola CBS 122712]|uniref:CS-domain-containing protein n=1 Tax=Aspergillus eucalypticola (strain CBS 122712 / IBT 29274) TaxID=1448314 RepID=A0A317VLE2_ASPEC|nr:CS-domain-containing protein [Aspergillus eucalypticola CBS 122712]PWY74665.1 CS-domain-containing protein [Aspergillus eucalypticola CBS 122712]